MKQFIFAVILALSLSGLAILCGNRITAQCDHLLLWLENEQEPEEILERWESFSERSAFVTPYDLIRSADSNAEHYAALIASEAAPPDIEAAREVLVASIRDIRRVHALSWELIF